MKTKRFKYLIFIINVVMVLFVFLLTFFSSQVKAASAYDNAYHSQSSMAFTRSGCPTVNLNSLSDVVDFAVAQNVTSHSTISSIANGGAGFLVIYTGTDGSGFRIAYTTASNASYSWATNNVNLSASSLQMRRLLYNDSSCGWSKANFTGNQQISHETSWRVVFQLGTVNFNIPTDYEGEMPVLTSSIPQDWIGIYRTTDSLELTRPANSCSDVHINSWYGLVQDSSLDSGYKTDLATAIATPETGWWSLTMFYSNKDPGGFSRQGRLLYGTSGTTLNWSHDGLGSVGSSSARQIVFWLSSSCEITLVGTTSGGNFGLSSGEPSGEVENYLNVFIAGNVNKNYPAGYNGDEIRETYTPPASPTYIQLELEVIVSGTQATFKVVNVLPPVLNGCYPRLKFYVAQLAEGGSWESQFANLFGATTEDWVLIHQSNESLYTTEELTLQLSQFPYVFGVEAVDEPFVWIPEVVVDGELINPEDCSEEQMDYLTENNIQLKPGAIEFWINGESRTFNSLNSDCTEGVCVMVSEYEDCGDISGFGDLVDFIPCQYRNMLKKMKNLFIEMFVPDSTRITNRFNDYITMVDSQLGFVAYPVSYSYQTFVEIYEVDESCTFSTPNSDFFGKQINLNLCQMETSWPAGWTLAVTLFRIVTVGLLIYASIGLYMKLFRSSNDS